MNKLKQDNFVLLIDGNNLLFAVRDHVTSHQLGREALCTLVGRWAVARKREVHLFFDGGSPTSGVVEQMRRAGVEVRFSGDRTADELIEAAIERDPQPTRLWVVTGDRAIQSAAKRRRCRCTSSVEFADLLRSDLADAGPKPVSPTRNDDPPKDTDVEGWMTAFGYDAAPREESEEDLMGPVDP